MNNFNYRIEERTRDDGTVFLTINFDDQDNANLSYFLLDESHRLTITSGRVDVIRDVVEGNVESWESGGNSTYWTVKRDITTIGNYFEDEPELDPAPPVLLPTATFEELILAWRTAEENFERRHPDPGPR